MATCPECKKSFRSRGLNKHIALVHGVIKNLVKEPVKDLVKPVKNLVKEPVKDLVKPVKNIVKEPVKDLPKWHPNIVNPGIKKKCDCPEGELTGNREYHKVSDECREYHKVTGALYMSKKKCVDCGGFRYKEMDY